MVKRYSLIIYKKGIRLFYANIIEGFINFYDSFLIKNSLNLHYLGLYAHAKQYLAKFLVLDKSFFQAYSVRYMNKLNGKDEVNISFFIFGWYVFLLIVGVAILEVGEYVVGILTHGKMVDSVKMLAIFYVLVFFRSNQMQYNCQILYNKKNELFVFINMIANILSLGLLTLGVFHFGYGIGFIVLMYSVSVIFRSTFIKFYALYKFRNYDRTECFFWLFLCAYLYMLFLKSEWFSDIEF